MDASESPRLSQLRELVKSAPPLSMFTPGMRITVRDRMAGVAGLPKQYTYTLQEPVGKNFHPGFRPHYSPGEMLRMGVFSGRYLNDSTGEFPREWFEGALARGKLRPDCADPGVNLFKVKSRKPVKYWRDKGWIPLKDAPDGKDRDARGWFQWFCRYWIGRRVPEVDDIQIARWKSFGARHKGQVAASYARLRPADVPHGAREKMAHRARQRQGLLQWSHNCYI